MLDKAAKAQAAADAKLKEVEAREQQLKGEVDRIRGLIEKSRGEYELGRDIKSLKGPGATKALLARLRREGFELDTRDLAAAVLEDDGGEDRPLTVRELRRLEQEREAAAKAEADEKAKKNAEAQSQAKAKAEATFLALVPSKAPTAAKVLARLGAHGRSLLIERAYEVQARLIAEQQPYDLESIAARVERRIREEYPEWAPSESPAPTSDPAAPAPAGKRPTAISNAATTRGSPPKPLSQMTEDERWAEYERKQKQGARLWERASATPPSQASSTRSTRGTSSPMRSSPSCPRWPWRRRCPSPAPSTASGSRSRDSRAAAPATRRRSTTARAAPGKSSSSPTSTTTPTARSPTRRSSPSAATRASSRTSSKARWTRASRATSARAPMSCTASRTARWAASRAAPARRPSCSTAASRPSSSRSVRP